MENLEHQASVFFAEKEYAKALEIYTLLYQGNPKNENYCIACGNCYDALKELQKALDFYHEALKINKSSEAALLNISTCNYELKNYEKSAEYAERILDLNPQSVAAWQNLANIAFCNNNYEKALEYYKKMYNINSNSYIAMINIANTYYCLGKYVLALDFAKKSLTKHPSSVTGYLISANSLNAMGKYEKAINLYMRALELDNSKIDILNSISESYHALNDWENCLLFAWRYLKNVSEKSNSLHLNFGYLLYECFADKSPEMAQKFAAKWQKYFPENAIVNHMSSALLNGNSLQESDPEFIKETFDTFAADFDRTLADLEYQAPTLIAEALEKNLKTSIFSKYHILDLGCGTGLCGQKIKKFASFKGLIGVDLSSKMLEIAESKKIYNKLICDDVCHYLENTEYFFHVITAADMLTYFGDLTKIFVRISRSLTPDGLFVFTFSENDYNKNDFFLAPSSRFVHTLTYVERVLKSAGLRLISCERAIIRNEAESPVYGYVTTAKKPNFSKPSNNS